MKVEIGSSDSPSLLNVKVHCLSSGFQSFNVFSCIKNPVKLQVEMIPAFRDDFSTFYIV